MSTTSFDDMKQIVTELFAVWSSAEIDKAAPLLCDDFSLIDHGVNHSCQGIDGVKEFFADAAVWNDTKFELTDFFVGEAGNSMAGLWVLTCSHSKTGKSVSLPGMSTFVFKDGKVFEENDYYSAAAIVAATQED